MVGQTVKLATTGEPGSPSFVYNTVWLVLASTIYPLTGVSPTVKAPAKTVNVPP